MQEEDFCDGHPGTSNAAHCWHDTGKYLASDPPQLEEVCCFCAATHYRRSISALVIADGHGPHLPSRDHIFKGPNARAHLPPEREARREPLKREL